MSKTLSVEQKRNRWNRLTLIGYVAHQTGYPETYSRDTGGRLNPSWGPAWLKKIEARIYRCKRRMLEREGAAGTRYTVSWGPERHGTYAVDRLIRNGGEGMEEALSWDEETLSYAVIKEVEGWKPLPNVSADSEGGQGFIYCSPADLPEVKRRLGVLEPYTLKCEDLETDQWEAYGEDGGMLTAPKTWDTTAGYSQRRKGGRVTLRTPETIERPTREDLLEDVDNMVKALDEGDLIDLRRRLKRAAIGKLQDAYRDPCVG